MIDIDELSQDIVNGAWFLHDCAVQIIPHLKGEIDPEKICVCMEPLCFCKYYAQDSIEIEMRKH